MCAGTILLAGLEFVLYEQCSCEREKKKKNESEIESGFLEYHSFCSMTQNPIDMKYSGWTLSTGIMLNGFIQYL